MTWGTWLALEFPENTETTAMNAYLGIISVPRKQVSPLTKKVIEDTETAAMRFYIEKQA
jgi:hypothetical protein